jgi:hypothetical protein
MKNLTPTPRLIAQGRALVRAIESIGAIQADWALERFIASLLLALYKRKLRGIIEAAPAWVGEEISGAGERRESDGEELRGERQLTSS